MLAHEQLNGKQIVRGFSMAEFTTEELAALVQDGRTEYVLPLWKRVEPLAKSMARRRIRGEWRAECCDLEQAAFVAMVDNTLKRFNSNDGVKFRNVFYNDARASFVHAMNLDRKHHETISIEGATSENGDSMELAERLIGPDNIQVVQDSIYREQLRTALEQALEGLTVRQAQVIRARFLHGLSRAKAAEQLGVNVSSIDRTAGRALEQLRRSPVLLHFLQDNSRSQA